MFLIVHNFLSFFLFFFLSTTLGDSYPLATFSPPARISLPMNRSQCVRRANRLVECMPTRIHSLELFISLFSYPRRSLIDAHCSPIPKEFALWQTINALSRPSPPRWRFQRIRLLEIIIGRLFSFRSPSRRIIRRASEIHAPIPVNPVPASSFSSDASTGAAQTNANPLSSGLSSGFYRKKLCPRNRRPFATANRKLGAIEEKQRFLIPANASRSRRLSRPKRPHKYAPESDGWKARKARGYSEK